MSDSVLFKFRKIDKHLLKSLVHGEIYFSRPEGLNDPFDCRVNIPEALENAISKSTSPSREKLQKLRSTTSFLKKVQADLEKIGVCSFSLKLNSPLMWAHYADNHRGICMTYRLPESFFYENADHILGIDRVNYGTNPLSDWFIQEAPKMQSFEKFVETLIQKALTVKAKPWHYEKEVRIIRRTDGIEVIDKQFLKQVCFGLKTPESDRTLVRKLLDDCGYDVNILEMIPKVFRDFGFKPSKIRKLGTT
jgi:hypothetical protein